MTIRDELRACAALQNPKSANPLLWQIACTFKEFERDEYLSNLNKEDFSTFFLLVAEAL